MLAASLLLVVLLGLVGCGRGGHTKAHFDLIKVGMTQAEVEGILGKPDGELGNAGGEFGGGEISGDGFGGGRSSIKIPGMKLPPTKMVLWGTDERGIVVNFQDGKVASKSQKGL
jgi:hypothetical protein